MTRQTLLMAVAWLVPAIAAAAVGMTALDIAGAGILGQPNRPLSQQDVARQLAPATTGPSTSAAPSSGSVPATPAGERWLNTPGGTVLAYCQGDLAVLHTWVPATGYRDVVDDVKRGPAPVAAIRFIQGKTEVDVNVTCHGGVPQASASTESH